MLCVCEGKPLVPAQLIVSFELALRRFYCFLCKCQEQPSPSLSPQMRALDLREMLGDQSQMSSLCCRSVSAPCALEATLQAQVLMRPPQLPCLFHHFVFHNSRRTFSLACNMGREYEWKKVLTGLLTPPKQVSFVVLQREQWDDPWGTMSREWTFRWHRVCGVSSTPAVVELWTL